MKKTSTQKDLKMKAVNVYDTRFPSLTQAVLDQIGEGDTVETRDTLQGVVEHSADAGWPGFTYCTDTIAFFFKNRTEIRKLLSEVCSELGQTEIETIRNFGCLVDSKRKPEYSAEEAGVALYSTEETDSSDCIRNALAWFALEEIARELNPDL